MSAITYDTAVVNTVYVKTEILCCIYNPGTLLKAFVHGSHSSFTVWWMKFNTHLFAFLDSENTPLTNKRVTQEMYHHNVNPTVLYLQNARSICWTFQWKLYCKKSRPMHTIFFKCSFIHSLLSVADTSCSDIVRNLKTFQCLVEKERIPNAHENTMKKRSNKHTLEPCSVLRGGLVRNHRVHCKLMAKKKKKQKTLHSHHLRPGHGVLMRVVVWIPVSKTIHVIVWVHWGSFVRHGDLPKLGQSGWAGGEGVGAVEIFPLWSAAMLHYLFILGAFILKPYFHLKRENAHNCPSG